MELVKWGVYTITTKVKVPTELRENCNIAKIVKEPIKSLLPTIFYAIKKAIKYLNRKLKQGKKHNNQ